MPKKPTYEDLEQRVKELQREVARCRRAEKEALADKEKLPIEPWRISMDMKRPMT
jgi:hypothetical protein